MEDLKMLNLLKRIKLLLQRNSLTLAIDLIELEVENLQGITEKKCKNTIYPNYDWYCNDCYNLNCKSNKKSI